MSFREEFELLLRACYPVIYIPTLEEERVEASIAESARQVGNRVVYTWDFVEGYQDNPNNQGFGKRKPFTSLRILGKII